MRFVAGRGAVAKRLVRGAAVAERHRENVASQAAVAEKLTPNEVCCWQGSRLGDPSGKQNREVNEKAKSGSRRGDCFKNLLPFEISILNCRLEFSKNLKRCRVFHTFIVL